MNPRDLFSIALCSALLATWGGGEVSGQGTPKEAAPRTIAIAAKKFEFQPSVIRIKKGERVMLELTSLDRVHGFESPDLGLHARVEPGKTVRLPLTGHKAGTFEFHCDVFCGDGHEDMTGEIVIGP